MPEDSIRNILLRAADFSILLITMRQVTQHHMLNFVSLKLEVFSLENLHWVVKSLALDRVTPTHNVIINRIKQSFGLKFKGKIWKFLLDEMYAYILHCKEEVPFSPFENVSQIDSWKKDLVVSLNDNPFVQSQKEIILSLESKKDLKPEDNLKIEVTSKIWIKFKSYIDELFDEDLIFFNNSVKENQELAKPANPVLNEPFYRKNSEENVFTNQSLEEERTLSRNQSYQFESLSNTQQSKKISTFSMNNSALNNYENQGKAIPGGRHGLTQFIKYFGPDFFRDLSYGLLSRLVQMAIDQKILKHYKTFLVKNGENNLDSDVDEKNKNDKFDKESKLKIIKEKLIECLIERKNYIPLAQLKKFLFKKINFKLDLKKLGFSKLKDLLLTFDEVQLESLNNHFYLQLIDEKYKILKQKFPKKKEKKEFKPILADLSKDSIQIDKNPPRKPMYAFPKKNPNNNFSSQNLFEKNHMNFSINNFSAINPSLKNSLLIESKNKFNKLKSLRNSSYTGGLDHVFSQNHLNPRHNNNLSWNGGIENYTKNLSLKTGFSLEHQRRNIRTLSTFEGYLNRILTLIEEIVQENKFGMEMALVYKILVQKLKVDHFNPRIFGCPNFNSFLLTYADSSVDIQLTRNKRSGAPCLMLYPKNFRFGFKDNTQSSCQSSSRHLKITSQPFQHDRNLAASPSNVGVKVNNLAKENEIRSSNKKSSLQNNPNSWLNVINTSFLDDLPSSLGSHRRSLSIIQPQVQDEDFQGKNKKSNRNSNIRNTSYQYNPNHPNNNSNLEIKEYIEYLNIMLPEGRKSFNNTAEDSKMHLTFLSAGPENSEHSVMTIPSEVIFFLIS